MRPPEAESADEDRPAKSARARQVQAQHALVPQRGTPAPTLAVNAVGEREWAGPGRVGGCSPLAAAAAYVPAAGTAAVGRCRRWSHRLVPFMGAEETPQLF